MNEELERKIKIIGKLENIDAENLIDSILEKYIEEYTSKRAINWSIFDKVEDTTSDNIIKIYKAWTDMLKKVLLWSEDEEDRRTIFEKWDDRCFEEAKREQIIYEAKHGQWSPTGWVYDRDTCKWDPPEYLIKESEEKWKWDDEKKIWIDLEKKRRVEKHKAYLASTAGTREPTYEEWKAQREKEKTE